MRSKAFNSALAKPLSVLFCNIGWSEKYDGRPDVQGDFDGLPPDRGESWEAKAFLKTANGYECGIGRGRIAEMMHVVFVSRDPSDGLLKSVGIYASARVVDANDDYPRVTTKHALSLNPRPVVSNSIWPGSQGVRRWAFQHDEPQHPKLYRYFQSLVANSSSPRGATVTPTVMPSEIDSAVEGKLTERFVKHRRRELRLRLAKIDQALKSGRGRLICEVPRCGFEFQKKYGALGERYAHVHHTRPLSKADEKGEKIRLNDLAVVCANCHSMIHRGGKCRSMKSLIPNL